MHGTIANSSQTVRPIRRDKNAWTLKEHEVVVDHWPDIETIRRILPHRTKVAVQSFAGKCNLRRDIHMWTTTEDAQLRKLVRAAVPRKQIARDMDLTLNQVNNRMRYVGLTCGRRPPQSSGHPLMDAVRQRAFKMNISMRDLDEECRSGSALRRWSPARKIALKTVQRAVTAMGGRLSVEWEPLDAE